MKGVIGSLVAIVAAGASFGACSQNSVTVPIRSFERPDRAAFLCLDATSDVPGRALESCRTLTTALAFNDYASAPHAVALVTQTTRGELAVVDVTAGAVVDADRSTPGFNFFPIGSIPTDVVATPGSNAAFVASADPSHPGLFAIPSRVLSPILLRAPNRTPLTLTSFAACSLPAAPGEMAVVLDQAPGATPGTFRSLCSGEALTSDDGILASEAQVFGTAKLVVALPERGELVIVDAATVLAITPGSFDPCPIERVVALGGDPLPGPGAPATDVDASDAATPSASDASEDVTSDPADASGEAGDGAVLTTGDASLTTPAADAAVDAVSCTVARPGPSWPRSAEPHPQHLALSDDGRLFISDDRASVIHVVDVSDPCAAAELPPLVPTSVVDPSRTVVTGAIAVSPLTSDQKRFLYAVDLKDNGTLMIFDVSAGTTSRTPILRPDLQWSHEEPPDRFVMQGPVQSLAFATREVPLEGTQQNGTFERGHLCDPNDPSDPYRAQDGVAASAGPATLRGLFAFLTLTTGRVQVLDVDDFDRACRRPRGTDSAALGCPASVPDAVGLFPAASDEVSCNVVERHRPRSSQLISNANQQRRAPAMQGFPQLTDQNGAVLTVDPQRPESNQRPKLLGPDLTALSTTARGLIASVTSVAIGDSFDATFSPVPYGTATASAAPNNWVAFDVREPRVHVDQTWTVTYEGRIADFRRTKGRLLCADPARRGTPTECERGTSPSHFDLYDSSAAFCDRGVQGTALAASMNIAGGDLVQIVEPLPPEDDTYWTTNGDVACTRQLCEAKFATPDIPSQSRELEVETAFQDHLVLRPSHPAPLGAPDPAIACCFPYPISYAIRGSKQWIVLGSRTPFQHHLVVDPARGGACTSSCDPNLALLNGRVAGRPATAPVLGYGDSGVFHNAQLRFVVWEPSCIDDRSCTIGRDWSFRFDEVGGFNAQSFGLSGAASGLPQSTQFVPGISQLAIVDGSSGPTAQGLVLLDLNRLGAARPFY